MIIHLPLWRKSCSRFETSVKIIFYLTTKPSLPRAQSGSVLWPVFASHAMLLTAILFWTLSQCHVIKISKIFGDFVPRDPACARAFSGRFAILKIVEELALGTRLGLSSNERQGWITSAHVRDVMSCVGANGLGAIPNLEKMAIEIPVHESSNGLVKWPQVILACYPARVRLIN